MARQVVGLLMAAGRGRRFAAAAPAGTAEKLVAMIDGVPVATHACRSLAAGCDTVVAVVRPDAPAALLDALDGVRRVVAPEADLGMGHSLAAAARALAVEAPVAVLVLPADMPWVSADTVRRIVAAARDGHGGDPAARIVVPVLADGRRGHPVSFGAAHLPALAHLSGDRGARGLLDTHPLHTITVDDAGILRDVDTPTDLPPS
ncbi:MAG: nucleotidyltransferase family protein [Burkholderiaceae bacterium]